MLLRILPFLFPCWNISRRDDEERPIKRRRTNKKVKTYQNKEADDRYFIVYITCTNFSNLDFKVYYFWKMCFFFFFFFFFCLSPIDQNEQAQACRVMLIACLRRTPLHYMGPKKLFQIWFASRVMQLNHQLSGLSDHFILSWTMVKLIASMGQWC